MDANTAIDVGREAVGAVLVLSAPVLIVAAVTGIVIGLIQAVTQIHDASILFAIRAVIVGMVLAISLPWLIEHYTSYARDVWLAIPETTHGGPGGP